MRVAPQSLHHSATFEMCIGISLSMMPPCITWPRGFVWRLTMFAPSTITGQKPSVRKAKKSIANFKLREGNEIGAKVTLRGDRMWEFYDRLVSLAIPRIRDFRGMPPKQFDGHGNYTFGLTEQLVFPEIDYDRIDSVRGMNITIVTTAETDEHGRALLNALGFPFRRDGQG